MSIKIEDLQTILIESSVSVEKRSEIIKNAEEFERIAKEENESAPRVKQKFTVIVRGDEDLAEKVQQAWIVRTPEDVDDNTVINRLTTAAVRHNENVKKARHKVSLWRDMFNYVKRRTTKEQDIQVDIKTKEPVRVLVLPTEEVQFES